MHTKDTRKREDWMPIRIWKEMLCHTRRKGRQDLDGWMTLLRFLEPWKVKDEGDEIQTEKIGG